MKRTRFALLALCALTLSAHAQLRVRPYVTSGLSLPVDMVQDPTQANVQYVLQKEGLIRTLVNGNLQPQNLINLTPKLDQVGEKLLFSLAFAPDYAVSGKAYVCYVDNDRNTKIEEYRRSSGNPLQLDPSTAKTILLLPPSINHWGGTLRFGPDGYLYTCFGDGSGGNDPDNNAQNPALLNGKFIRIDPRTDDFPLDANRNYHIPADNPFVGSPLSGVRPEIWSFGVRNPWKWSFDDPMAGGDGAMYIADVGQDQYEEIDYEPSGLGGRNYGWRVMEGAHPSGLGGTLAFTPVTAPIYEYPHAGNGKSITGGFVYHGSSLPGFYRDRYFFGDFVTGQTWSVHVRGGQAVGVIEHTGEVGSAGLLTSLDVDASGELYLVDFNGSISQIVLAPSFGPNSFSMFRGAVQSGGLTQLTSSDESYLALLPGPIATGSESPITLEVSGTCPTNNISSLSFTVEARANTPGLSQQIQLFNYSTSTWVSVDARAASVGEDARVTVTASPSFVQSGTRSVKARVLYRQTGPVVTYPYVARVDQILWSYDPVSGRRKG